MIRTRSHPLRAGLLVAGLLALATLGTLRPVAAALPASQKALLTRYLQAIAAAKYDVAYQLLSKKERAYFASPNNYASIFTADRVKLASFRILGSRPAPGGAVVAVVSEQVSFYDHAHDRTGSLTAKVPFGIVPDGGGYGIKDPYHPWRALAPAGWTATGNGLTVTVRKLSFFTGRIELLLTFQNRGDATVTVLPYGRTVVRDDAGHTHAPIATKLPGLTDANLYTGVRLAPSAQYTGLMTFFTPDRFTPKTLSATIAPVLQDGADAPFQIELPAFAVSP